MQIHLKNYDCSMFSELKAERDYQHEAGMRLLTDALKTDFNLQIERKILFVSRPVNPISADIRISGSISRIQTGWSVV